MSSIDTSNTNFLSPAFKIGKQPGKAGFSAVPLPPQESIAGEIKDNNKPDPIIAVDIKPDPRIATAHRTAEQLIATTLIKPILAQVRASNNAPPPFGQTQAEKQFGSLLDNRIADDIAKASNFPIAQRIAEQMLKNSITLPDTQPINPAFTHSPVDIFG